MIPQSEVYFADVRVTPKDNMFEKFKRLLTALKIDSLIKPRDLVCIKLHFGELGNMGYIHPVWVRELVNIIKEQGAKPYLSDTNTLYGGKRADAVDHITTAILNGFSYEVVGCPIIIGDGLRGEAEDIVEINKKHFKEVSLAKLITQADALISLAHFKGHALTGFGATLKNLGMGIVSKKGKYKMHINTYPLINRDLCKGCGFCTQKCPQNALCIKDKKVWLIKERCIGCGECLSLCQEGAIKINWKEVTPQVIQERIVEACYAVLKLIKKAIFINFVMQVSPDCDCCSFTDAYIVPDIGILGSTDAVALDEASVRLVNESWGNRNSALKTNYNPGQDKIRGMHPEVDWQIQLKYAEELKLGTRNYKLIKI
jgi:uncharacterized Fe-S center protein